jgi:cell pole-organizing protein PopZ
MSDATDPPSMDDILASIRRIIAEEDGAAPPPGDTALAPPSPAPVLTRVAEEPLELTHRVEPAAPSPRPTAPTPPAPTGLVSDIAADASRQALATLSSLVVAGAKDNTLEGVVREMLRPMLKAWLDDRLPAIVESAVAREVARITDKSL